MKPSAGELEILQILWKNGEMTVKEVNEEINKVKESGYTTTLKTMQIMFEKKFISRQSLGRSHVYKADVTEEETKNDLLDKFIESTYNGSAMKLVMQALGNHDASKEELDQIRELLDEMDKGN
ncbi:MAG: BlaI/MecI/CopY family transcriptional regulator [Candidatus Delongbacteria bacterium]|nr:BlaI/MecI/CopY family transcriptional regulator [Candidatus Delongbacteria bacterium]